MKKLNRTKPCKVCKRPFTHKNLYARCCSTECMTKIRFAKYEKIYAELESLIEKSLTFVVVEKMINENDHSYSMIRDLMIRDFNLDKEKYPPSYFWTVIKKKNIVCDLAKCNKMPQWHKLQYRYPKGFTVQDIKKDIAAKCKRGQIQTAHKRKANGSYLNQPFERENSPLCLEFYTSRGFSELVAKEKISTIALAGATGVQHVRANGLEKKVCRLLKEKKCLFIQQHSISLLFDEKLYNKRSYVYDFYLPDENILIETNGVYWHASPKIYKSKDIIKLPRFGCVEVDKIWAIDAHKKKVAEDRGYRFFTLWEDEIEKIYDILQNKKD